MIDAFQDEYWWLSNFSEHPVLLNLTDTSHTLVPTVEHAFAASKTCDFHERLKIAEEPTPGRAKRAGRRVKLRPDWEGVKIEVMTLLVRDKFNRHPDIAAKLDATGDEQLVEGNNWGDTIWGVCEGMGENHLGIILMQVRTELRKAA